MNQKPEEQKQESSPIVAWFQEMGRRHVFRILAIYVAIGWGFTEIVAGIVEQVGAPGAIATFTTIAFIVGFPIVLFLAWMFDVGRSGVHRVPTRRKGQLLVSLALAVLIAASYGIFRYLPRNDGAVDAPLSEKTPDEIVMAVLPFTNLSAGSELDYLGQALAEDLLNGVAVIPDVRVKTSLSSFALADRNPLEIAGQLGVNRLLDGTFREQDGNLRISARLTDTGSGDVVWTRVLTDSLSNIYIMEDQIAKDVAAGLGRVHPASQTTVSRQVDPETYQLYLQARQSFVNPWLDTEDAIRKVRQVLDRAPNFPEALSMMGFLDTSLAWITENRGSPRLKMGEEYALRALEADPDLSEAYAVLALNYALQYRWKESRQVADQAIEAAGARPLNVVYTLPFNNLGHRRRSLDILLRVFDEDPLNFRAIQNIMEVYVNLGEDDNALEIEQVLIERGQRYQRHYLIPVFVRRGDMKTAQELASLLMGEHGFGSEVGPHYVTALATGRSEAFEQATDEALRDGRLPLGQAIWNYMAAGADEDKVFGLVSEAIPSGAFNQISLMHPVAARYRQDRRFVGIYNDLGLVDYWRSVERPDFCESESIQGLCE